MKIGKVRGLQLGRARSVNAGACKLERRGSLRAYWGLPENNRTATVAIGLIGIPLAASSTSWRFVTFSVVLSHLFRFFFIVDRIHPTIRCNLFLSNEHVSERLLSQIPFIIVVPLMFRVGITGIVYGNRQYDFYTIYFTHVHL